MTFFSAFISPILFPERHPAVMAYSCSWKGLITELLILAGSGLITSLAFPGINQDWIAWWAVVPLIILCTGKSTFRAFLYGFVWGYFWNLSGCFFLREIMIWAPFAFGAVLGVFSGFWAMLIPSVFRHTLLPLEIRLASCIVREGFFKHSLCGELV